MTSPPCYGEGVAKTLPEGSLPQGFLIFYVKINENPSSYLFHGIPFIP
jgi:hypothetical protein